MKLLSVFVACSLLVISSFCSRCCQKSTSNHLDSLVNTRCPQKELVDSQDKKNSLNALIFDFQSKAFSEKISEEFNEVHLKFDICQLLNVQDNDTIYLLEIPTFTTSYIGYYWNTRDSILIEGDKRKEIRYKETLEQIPFAMNRGTKSNGFKRRSFDNYTGSYLTRIVISNGKTCIDGIHIDDLESFMSDK